MTLADVLAEYPSIVFEEPTVSALAKQVRELCSGSDFEKSATEHYFEATLREKLELTGIPTRWEQRRSESEDGLIIKCEAELKREYGRTATKEEISSLATHRHNQVRDTVTQFVDKSLGLLEAFCRHTEYLAKQVLNIHAEDFERQLDPKIDARIKAWFHKKPEGMIKAVFKDSPFDREATVNDLDEVKTRE